MGYMPNSAYVGEFTTQRFDTGAATDADSLPTVTANKNGTDDATFSAALTVAKIDTGRYKVTGTVPVTYAAGDVVNISVAATVNSVAGKAVIDSFVVVAAVPKVDVDTIKTQTVTCGAGVTVLASVGTAATSTAQTGNCYPIVNDTTNGNAAIKTAIGAVKTVVDAIAAVLAGITVLANWLRAMVRKDAADATAKSEINASGGTYDETTDSQQAQANRDTGGRING